MAEYVEMNDLSGFTCICGNTPDSKGAYPCDRQGNEVEPPPSDDEPGQCYCCDHCGRVFDGTTGEIVFQREQEPRQ